MESPAVSFGIITDIQHADVPNGLNYNGEKVRYFRNSINILSDAIRQWNASSTKVSFVLQLGDIIDGCNARTPGASEQSLERVMQTFSQLNCPVYHATGNHELYNFKRTALKQKTIYSNDVLPALSSDCDRNYYSFCPVAGLRVIVLDTFDTSLLGTDVDSTDYKEALKIFRRYNQNEDLNNSSGLTADVCMYAAYNGAVSEKQLRWLEEMLSEAESNKEKVIVAGHNPVYPGSSVANCLCWNHHCVVEVLQRHSSCVLAYFAGHDHAGGYAQDTRGISYITFPAVVDTEPGSSCYATASIFTDRIEIIGAGIVPSYTLHFKT